MPKGGRPSPSEVPQTIHTEKTHEFRAPRYSSEIPTHAKPNLETLPQEVALRRLAEDAGEHLIEDKDIIEESPDTEAVQKFQKQLIESFATLLRATKEDEEEKGDKVSKKPHLTAKGKRILKTYAPRLLDKVPTPRPGKEAEDAPYQIPRDPLSTANREGMTRLLRAAGFAPETTTLEVVRHELSRKKTEVTQEIERRSSAKKGQIEAGFDTLLRQTEALELLEEVTGTKEEPTLREKILTEAKSQTAREKEARDKQLKPLVVERIKREIKAFAQTFTERYEAPVVKQKIVEQRSRPTETALPVISDTNFFTRFQHKAKNFFSKVLPNRSDIPASSRTPEPSLRPIEAPTFNETGFLSSTKLQSALENDFTTIEELRDKVTERLLHNEQRLEESYSAELAEHPVATLDALADVDDQELKQLLGNHEVLERILEIIDNREIFLEGKDLKFDKEKISSQTTELQQIVPKKPAKNVSIARSTTPKTQARKNT